MYEDAKFCFECGRSLVMRYPGNDPEMGPAALRCPVEHPTLFEVVDQEAMGEDYLMRQLRNLLERTKHPEVYDDKFVTPDIIKSIETIQAWLSVENAAAQAIAEADQEEFEALHGPDDEYLDKIEREMAEDEAQWERNHAGDYDESTNPSNGWRQPDRE